MNRKKSIILMATFVMLLSITSLAYAWTLSGTTSSIDTGLFTVTGKSTTSCDVICDRILAECALYRNGININSSLKEAVGVKSVSASCGGSNLPGQQLWEVYGLHIAEYNGDQKIKRSYAGTNY